MEVKEFLKTQNELNLTEIARRMWPDNKGAKSYLSTKLNGRRPFTDEDEKNAVKAILGICNDVIGRIDKK